VTSSRSLPPSLALLWLIGVALRLAILAVPPAIPALRGEFSLSGTEIAALSGAPIIIFAAASMAGSRLVARIGVIAAVMAGLLLTALGSAARSLAFDTVSLLVTTVVMGIGVAVAQPAMPALVGRWLPKRLVLGTGVYTNGLLVGEIFPVAVPLLSPALADNWRVMFAAWAVPIVAIAALVFALAPREETRSVTAASGRWWPDWPAIDVLRLGLIFGGVGPLYFGTNAFLRGYLSEAGRADLISPALTALNLGQLPASFLLIAFARRIERRALAVHPFELGWACRHRRDRRDRERLDRGRRGRCGLRRRRRFRTRAHAAAAVEQARRGGAGGGRHVHHQLRVDGGGVAALRRALGLQCHRPRGVLAYRHRRHIADRLDPDH
jgi:CP family cyanate transporter-like MFS transporter